MISQDDPFSSVRIKKKSSASPAKEIQSALNQDPFSSVRMIKEPEESTIDKILRGGSRQASRAVETLAGIPGEIGDIVQSGVLSGLESLVGIPSSNEAKEKMKGYRPPTSQELQNVSEKASKGYLSPKNETEEGIDEFTKTVTSLLGPMKFRKALALASIGTGVQKGLKTLGFDEPIQDLGKFGSIFTLSMFNPKGVQKLYSGLYDKVKNSVPGIDLDVKSLETRLNTIERHLKKGVATTTKNAVLKPVEELKSKIKNGKISAEDLIQARFDVNELMGDPELLKRGKNAFPLVTSAINKTIKQSPNLPSQIKKDFIAADEAYGAFQQSKKASNFIKKNLPDKPLKSALFGAALEALTYPEAIVPTGAAIIAGGAGIKFYELIKRVNANPTMRKYYLEMLKAASNENKTATLKFVHKLDKELENQD
jgi:hypothetical protein